MIVNQETIGYQFLINGKSTLRQATHTSADAVYFVPMS